MTWTMTPSPKGQITLPKEARDRLGAIPGDTILLVERRGRFELEAYGGDILRWYGALEVDGPQDWAALRRDPRMARGQEVDREPQDD